MRIHLLRLISSRVSITIAALFLLIATAQSVALAQGGVGSSRGLPGSAGGIHTIRGRVFYPDEPPAGTHAKVRLESTTSFGNYSTMTDDDGRFVFNQLEGGSYTVVVDGNESYETAREQITIERQNPSGRIIDVPLYLKPKASNPVFAGVPTAAVEHYNKANDFLRKNDTGKAIEQLEAAVKVHPTFWQALNQLGVQQLTHGKINEAVDLLAKAVAAAPPTAFEPRLNYGIALLNQKKFPEAEKELRAALEKKATSPTGHLYLGMALMNQKKLEEAQKELETAVASPSGDVGIAHKYLGGIYWGLRDYKRAAEQLELYLKMVPKAPDAERTKTAIQELRSKQ